MDFTDLLSNCLNVYTLHVGHLFGWGLTCAHNSNAFSSKDISEQFKLFLLKPITSWMSPRTLLWNPLFTHTDNTTQSITVTATAFQIRTQSNVINLPLGIFLRPCANSLVKDWAHCEGNDKASEPEAEDKPRERPDGEIPANLLLTFHGSWDKVRLDVYTSYKGATVQLDKSIRRFELQPNNFIYYSLSVR